MPNYIRSTLNAGEDEKQAADKTFDVRFEHIDSSTYARKEIFKIEGLKIDGAVEYDDFEHVFTATLDQDQNFGILDLHLGIECPNSENHTNYLSSLMNDNLDLFV